MRLGRHLLSEGVIGYSHRGGVLLSLEDVITALDFSITVDQAAGQASGWFLSPNRQFALDVSRREVVVEGRVSSLDPALVEVHFDGVYVDAILLGRWFPIDIKYDLSQLVVNIISKELLPVEQRLERQKARAHLRKGGVARSEYPRVAAPYRLCDWPFIDANAKLDQRRSGQLQNQAFRYSGLASGDLLYMSSTLFLAGDDEHSLTDVRLRSGRSDPDAVLLGPLRARSFAFGDIFTPEIPLIARSQTGRGVEISSFPLGRPSQFDRTTLHGELPLDWEVELYRNEVLLDFCLSRADGRYEFADVPLLFGLNVLRLVFYGPLGQRREEVQRILVGPGLVRSGEGYYRVAANQQGEYMVPVRDDAIDNELNGEHRYFVEYERGISRTMSVSGAGASFLLGERRRYYANFGLRAAVLGTFTRLDVSSEYQGGTAIQLATQINALGHNLAIEHDQLFDFASEWIRQNGDPVESLTRLRLDGVIPLRLLPRIPFSVAGEIERRESSRTNITASNRLSIFMRGVSVSNTVDGSMSRGGGLETTTRVNGSVLVSGRLRRLSLRGQLNYEPPPNHRFLDAALTAEYEVPLSLRSRFTVFQELLEDRRTSYAVGLSRTFDAFSCGLEGRYEDDENFVIRLSISFSLGRQPHAGRWQMGSRKIAKNGAALVRVFLDQNQDGRFDSADRPLPNIQLRHDGRAADMTDTKGVSFITDLPVHRSVEITIEEGSLEDPFWIPVNGGVTVMPRPGKTTIVEFPIAATGEVDGIVYLRRGTTTNGASNVEVQLVDAAGQVSLTQKTAFDGFYLFSKVPPGSYIVRISPSQLKRLQLLQPPDRTAIIEGNGTVVGGVDFTLEQVDGGD